MKNSALCTGCFKSLGVPSRMQIYKILKENNKIPVTKIAEIVDLTQPTVSYHLKEMEESGLLKRIKKGKEVFYELNTECPNYESDSFLNKLNFPGEK